MISRVRGTEDLLDLRLQNLLIKKIKSHLALYNYKEIQTPILEHTNLFIRSLGEETDVVSKEMYIFETESGDSICLRPEATAPTMRAFLEGGIQTTPWKVFSHGPMFRHERPQKGRWRQFSQVNIEVIGSSDISQDAHFIKMIDNFFNEVINLENYSLKVNYIGTLEDRKVYKEKLYSFLSDQNICQTCTKRRENNILRIFDCKNPDCQNIYNNAPKITEHLGEESLKEWNRFKDLLDILSVNYIHDTKLVRGLDYYNKTVFEFSSKELGAQDAFCGGGRYDGLAEQIGSKKSFPSIGAAIGIGRLMLLLKNIDLPQEPFISVILPMGDEQKTLALLLADTLQADGKCVEVLLEGGSMKSMMRRANKLGAKYALVLGEEEQQNGTVALKNMQTSEDLNIKQSEVLEKLI